MGTRKKQVRFNPFTESPAGKYFVGRENQLREFRLHLEGLKEKSPSHMYVAGVHGTGKTSYLVRLVNLASEHNIIGVLSNLDESTPRENISSVIRALLEGVQQRFISAGQNRISLVDDWDRGPTSTLFQHPRIDRLSSDHVRQDFETIKRILRDLRFQGR
jgi:hypothetical protein